MYSPKDHTFVVCAYGESEYLEACVGSLLEQSISTNVLFATSTPNALIEEQAERCGSPVCVNAGETGIAGDWNFAVSCVETPLVTIAHQDDVYSECYAEWMLEKIGDAVRPLVYFSDYGELRDGVQVDSSELSRAKRLLLKPCKSQALQSSFFIKSRVLSLGNPICCPAVTYVLDNLEQPLFHSDFKSNLDWDAWDRFSRLEGSFVFDDRIGMYHRVHPGSETSACIVDEVRTKEDLAMLERFWPAPIAHLINRAYSGAQQYNC